MTINEALKIEESNSNNIFLINGGVIWFAYERSAYRLMKYLPNLHPVKRNIAGNVACFIRFPHNRLGAMLALIKNTPLLIKEQSKEKIIIVGDKQESDEETAFNEWKKNIALPPVKVKIAKPKPILSEKAEEDSKPAALPTGQAGVKDVNNHILQKIKNYLVFNKTPLETMQFVTEIQEFLKQ